MHILSQGGQSKEVPHENGFGRLLGYVKGMLGNDWHAKTNKHKQHTNTMIWMYTDMGVSRLFVTQVVGPQRGGQHGFLAEIYGIRPEFLALDQKFWPGF